MSNPKLLASLSPLLCVIFGHTSAFSQTAFWQRTNQPSRGSGLYLISNSTGDLFTSGVFSGVFRSTDRGTNWTPIDSGFNGVATITYMMTDPNGTIYATLDYGDPFRSTNNGNYWSTVGPISLPYPVDFRMDAIAFSNGSIFVGGSHDLDQFEYFYTPIAVIFRSADSGATWTPVFNDSLLGTLISAFLADGPGRIFMGGVNEGIFHSTDKGDHWIRVSPPIFNSVYSLSLDSSGGILAGSDKGLFRSEDDGKSWMTLGLDGMKIISLLVTSTGDIFAGSDGYGILRSKDDGHHWQAINSGLTDSVFNSFGITPDGYIFASAFLGSIYRSVRSVTGVEQKYAEVPPSFSLSLNYPNPFNPFTSISFSIPKHTHVRLQVFDLLGQLIETLVNEDKYPGTYTVKWEAGTRSSGLYFYRISAGEFVQTKKAILLR